VLRLEFFVVGTVNEKTWNFGVYMSLEGCKEENWTSVLAIGPYS